jgi:hypothetical protein
LYGSPDALLENEDVLRALDLIANRLGKEIGQSEIDGSIRASQLRKMVYTKFGADLALHAMQALWLEAASDDERPSVPAVPNMPDSVTQFFEHEDAVPAHRWESAEARVQRERLANLGGWPGG